LAPGGLSRTLFAFAPLTIPAALKTAGDLGLPKFML
jgi:hypothetical protein